jgi:D-amino peptidase
VSGDQVAIAELRSRVPGAEAAEVKRALSNVAADVLPPERARERIRAAAQRALERARAGELAPYRGERAPYEIEVELRQPPGEHLARNLESLPEFERVGERSVRTLAPDMDQGFRRIAYLGYGNRPGALRY